MLDCAAHWNVRIAKVLEVGYAAIVTECNLLARFLVSVEVCPGSPVEGVNGSKGVRSVPQGKALISSKSTLAGGLGE